MNRDEPELFRMISERGMDEASARQAPPAGDAGPARASIDGQLVRLLLKSLGDPPVRVSLWNGDAAGPPPGAAVAEVKISSRGTLLKLLVDPEYQFGECYSEGTVEVAGDMVKLLDVLMRGLDHRPSSARQLIDWSRRRRSNTPDGSRDNIQHHYDLGNSFYELWLDREMSYTCAYFPHPAATLEEAQIAKMDHVCRKLRLRPGESVVEAGCGWGALALHMATRYGVEVKAFNISREQMAYARERAQKMGVGSRVEFVEDDYRNIDGRFDAFVSIGMLEHVGHDNYDGLGRLIDRALVPSGRGLIHSIGLVRPVALNAWIERRIFPGAEPPTLRQMLKVLEPAGFSVLDVENLRLHYALTLDHWLRRYEAAHDRILGMYGERFVRAWRLYLAGSQAAFTSGQLQLFQVLFSRQRSNDVPWTRAHLYEH